MNFVPRVLRTFALLRAAPGAGGAGLIRRRARHGEPSSVTLTPTRADEGMSWPR
jgi:hypothetical protein